MTRFCIENILGREILDSRGNPTLEIEITLEGGITSYASVPSGISVGVFEAMELRDHDPKRYHGMGVVQAIEMAEEVLSQHIIGKKFQSIQEFDEHIIDLDGTTNKANIGSNTSLALSLAFAKCLAIAKQKKLYEIIRAEYGIKSHYRHPIPMLNVINGGKHADNNLNIQEFMIVPVMTPEATIQDRIRLSCEFFYDLRIYLQKNQFRINVGDEGGFAPMLSNTKEALNLLMHVMNRNVYKSKFKIAIDAAASSFYNGKKYIIDSSTNQITNIELVQYYKDLLQEYPIISIEDPMAENDLEGWKHITSELSNDLMLVGDDLFVTNFEHLQHGIDNHLANAILIKPNQIGTITETIKTTQLAKQNNYDIIVSHRSGETEDTSLAHIAVGLNATYIKAGAPCRSERTAKYNELMRLKI